MYYNYRYDAQKNATLKAERNISFDEVIAAIDNGCILDIIPHHNVKKYQNQKILVMEIYDYIYLVPYIEEKNEIFLKTIFPSRKYTKLYLGGGIYEKNTKNNAKTKLSKYEQDIENNLEKGKPLSSAEKNKEMNKLKSAAKQHIEKRKKEKRISIRVFASDLERIKAIAEEEGLPYQTLVTSILHKFSLGRLVAKDI